MLTVNRLFETELRKMLAEQITKIGEDLSGGSAPDFAQYQRQVGRAWGLRAALEACDEVSSLIAKDQ